MTQREERCVFSAPDDSAASSRRRTIAPLTCSSVYGYGSDCGSEADRSKAISNSGWSG